MPPLNPVRRNIIWGYFLVSALLGASLATSLYEIWPDHLLMLGHGLVSFLIIVWLFIRLFRQASFLDESNFKSTHDVLTGLYNRRELDDVFERLWRESMREQSPISALFMDIDHFKIINDTYGHETGDHVLQAVASTIQSQLNRPLDLCCRWGGEEFVAVLPRTDEQGALKIANGMMSAIQGLKVTEGMITIDRITISIGIASEIVNADNVHDNLIDMADKAMFKAKLEGRNRVVLYRPGLHY